jgi:transcriptional regulator with XRE-family HTH domain
MADLKTTGLKVIRKELGLPQKEMAEKLGYSRDLYAMKENGFRGIGINELINISSALGRQVIDVLGVLKSNEMTNQE